jgi:hypothetical protein
VAEAYGSHFYLCPLALAQAMLADPATHARVSCGWNAAGEPKADDLVLFEAGWGAYWDYRERFEAQPGVVPLGEPWEPLPAAAVPVLEAFRQALAPTRAERVGVPSKLLALPAAQDATVAVDSSHTVSQALRKAMPHLRMF